MSIKKPFVTFVLLIGIGLLLLFSISYLWLPLIQSSQLLMAIAEALIIVLSLVAVFLGVSYFIIKKQQPTKRRTNIVSKLPGGTLTRIPVNNTEAPVITMTV